MFILLLKKENEETIFKSYNVCSTGMPLTYIIIRALLHYLKINNMHEIKFELKKSTYFTKCRGYLPSSINNLFPYIYKCFDIGELGDNYTFFSNDTIVNLLLELNYIHFNEYINSPKAYHANFYSNVCMGKSFYNNLIFCAKNNYTMKFGSSG